jgi:hypothetical protein
MLLPERRNEALITHIEAMPLKPIELPPAVARRFVDDTRAFHAEENPVMRDEIAARQLHTLRGYSSSRDRKLRLSDVKKMFDRRRAQHLLAPDSSERLHRPATTSATIRKSLVMYLSDP